MTAYSIELSQAAFKELKKVFLADKKLYFRLISAVEGLKTEPFSGKRLKGKLTGDFSLRLGDYRVIYAIQQAKLIIYIIDLGHRKEIYK